MPEPRKKAPRPRKSATRTTTKKTSAKSAPARRPITADDLVRFKLPSDPQVSPNGRSVVFVHKHTGEKNEYVSNLWLVDAARGKPRPFTNGDKDSRPRWSPDGTRIAFISEREKAQPQVHLIDATGGGEARALTRFPEGSFGELRWSPDGRLLAVTFREQDPDWTEQAKKQREERKLSDPPRVLDDWWYRLDGDGYFNGQRYRLYVIDVETGEHRCVWSKDTLGFLQFDFSPDSKKLAVTTNTAQKAMIQPWKDTIVIVDAHSGRTTRLRDLPDGPKTHVRWSPDGKWLAYAGREGTDGIYSPENLELWICDPKHGKARSLTGGEDYCLMAATSGDTAEIKFEPSLQWGRDSKRIYMMIGWHGESHVASIGVDGGTVVFHTAGAVNFDMGGLSADGKRIALTKFTANTLPDVHLGELTARSVKLRRLTDLNGPLLADRRVASISEHWVKTADGTKVHTWVMLPPDLKKDSKKRCPAVLEVHGGPHAQYGVGYFHEFQVLAAKGYIVVFSNPRGSKGYGRDHTAAIRGRWGTADWTDIQAVTKFMQKHPSIDPQRIAIMGGSYGGYMTNWAIGHTNAFAAAVTDRCVSNVVTMGGTSDFTEAPDDYFPGNHWDRTEARWEQSPIRYVGNAKTPTLIIHSEGDLRCNIEQAEQLFVALKLLNVPTRFVRYPRSTSHGMSRGGPPDMRLHRLEQITEWLGRYIGG